MDDINCNHQLYRMAGICSECEERASVSSQFNRVGFVVGSLLFQDDFSN